MPRAGRDCRVYWGSHGCDRRRGHRGKHRCECGSTGYGPGTRYFGEDVEPARGP
jgi:hypothetical protein